MENEIVFNMNEKLKNVIIKYLSIGGSNEYPQAVLK